MISSANNNSLQDVCDTTKVVKSFVNSTYLLRSCLIYSLTRVYICHPTYRENFKYEKKGAVECPTYRVYLCIYYSSLT